MPESSVDRSALRRAVELTIGVVSLALAVVLAVPVGFLLLWAVDPGFEPQPLAGFGALLLAACCLGLLVAARNRLPGSWWLAALPLLAAAATAVQSFETAGGPDKGRAERVERAMLAEVKPPTGARSSTPMTQPESSSDWGISIVNPPEAYTTARTDHVPSNLSATRAADIYQREMKREGFRVYRFLIHYPVEDSVHLGGHRGNQYLEVIVAPTGEAGLTATA